jgi:hypothetical protein
MSVTYFDPPGRLANTFEPIDFETDSLVTSISVEYNPSTRAGLRETVFDGTEADGTGGDFSPAFRLSTRTGEGPYTWSVRRAGRWPADFRLRVKEVPSAASGATPWSVLYHVDFSVLGAASFPETGAHTIDGLTWYLKGAFIQGGGVVQSSGIDATGLFIRSNFGSEGSENSNLRWVLPLAQIPGYNAAAPLALWGRLSSGAALGHQSNSILGLVSAATGPADMTTGERATRACVGTAGEDVTTNFEPWTNNATGPVGHTLDLPATQLIMGVQKLAPTITRRMVTAYVDGAPDPSLHSDGLTSPSAEAVRSHAATIEETLSVYFAHNFNGGSTQNFYLRELFIMQPGV